MRSFGALPRTRHVAVATAFALILAGASSTASAGTGDGVFKVLHTRSGTIGCQYAAGGSLKRPVLRCDIKGGLKPRPPRNGRCKPNPDFDLEWALGIVIQTTGRAQIVCAGDSTLGGRGRLLHHGSRFRSGGIACHMLGAQKLLCQNAKGHGFLLSPRRWRIF